jgi:predicted ATPase/class 3 adenylate cyclase
MQSEGTQEAIGEATWRALLSYLPPAVARALHAERRVPDAPHEARFPAAVLLADVSGFTALAERLASLGSAGAEELTLLLNRYFGRMIGLLELAGGEVVQFSGDALTAVFPLAHNEGAHQVAHGAEALAASVRRAWQAAEQMQAAMAEFTSLDTSVGAVELGMKIAIGAGEVLALSVGGVRGRWQYVIAGDPLRQVAEAEHAARRGETRLSPQAAELLPARVAPARPPLLPDWGAPDEASLAAVRAYIPSAISARLLAGQGEWLAELRRMTVLFLGIGGISYQHADGPAQLQRWMTALQQTVYRYDGSINKLLVDDKGTIAIALFGAPPLAHEDDPLRGLRCALDLQQLSREQGLRVAIGITTGQVFAGPVGSAERREYTVIGDRVNLAARLMGLAGAGRVLADHASYQATRGSLRWQALAPEKLKGMAAAVVPYQPLGIETARALADRRLQLIGRAAEKARIGELLDQLDKGGLQTLSIQGESGIGKSRLVDELERMVQERGLLALVGSGQAIEQQTPYRAWREVFEAYFGLNDTASLRERRERVLARLGDVAPALIERAPLLNDLLGLGMPENELTANLEPKLRQESLQAMLVDLIAVWADEQPLALILDDAHWLDSLSWQLALQTARGLRDRPLLLVIALRPLDDLPDEHPYRALCDEIDAESLVLGVLSEQETIELAAARLGVAELPEGIAALIARRANGHPFVAEELALSLRDTGAISIVEGRCVVHQQPEALDLPETVQGIVLSRIDRLPGDEQITLKVASVIGRNFGYATLHDVHTQQLDKAQLDTHMDSLVRRDLLLPPEGLVAPRSYSFKQIITQEVTYGTLLHTQRRELHSQVARWYERHAGEERPDRYLLLAYHWRHARDRAQERHYAALAGKKLANEYANAEAISYLSRALELTPEADEPARFELLWQRMQVYERLGEREAQRIDLAALELLAAAAGDAQRQEQVANGWAALYRDLSEYPAATEALERALALARRTGDRAGEARSLTLWGQVMEYQGAYNEARGYFEQALAIYRGMGYKRGEANNLSNLGNIAFYLCDYHAARSYDLQALVIRREIDDRAGEAVSLNNLSQASFELSEHASARAFRQQALELARSIGDRSTEVLILGAMGYDCFALGNYDDAQLYLEEAVQVATAIGDRRSAGNDLNQLGMVLRDVGAYAQARVILERSLQLLREIGELSFTAFTCLNIGYVLLDSDPAQALDYFQQTLELARESGIQDAEGYALSYRAYFHERQQSWEQAEADYRAALAVFETIEGEAADVEQLAGLARVVLAQGRRDEALAYARRCIAHLEQEGIVGIEFPFLLYQTCHDCLNAAGEHKQARELVEIAVGLLHGRVGALRDEALRQSMLHIPTNQRLIELWEGYRAREI